MKKSKKIETVFFDDRIRLIGGQSMYICVSKNEKGVVNRALYYSKKLGRARFYRQSFPLQEANANLELLKYKRKENAQDLCDFVNEVLGENFEVVNL